MKKKILVPIISGVAIIFLSASSVLHISGMANYSGSPVDGGATTVGQCSGCHSGGSSTPTQAVTATPAFGGSGNNKTYVAGTTYTITLTPSGSYPMYGMNLEIINSQGTTAGTSVAMFGTFGAAVSSNCQIYSAATCAPYPPCASHNTASASAFKFKWTAPASGTGFLYSNVLG
ncbi:MAG TPA: reeler domain-containing protein, partial [Bacteroidia bacterium]